MLQPTAQTVRHQPLPGTLLEPMLDRPLYSQCWIGKAGTWTERSGGIDGPKSISTAALVLAGEGGVVGPRGSRHVEGARSASV